MSLKPLLSFASGELDPILTDNTTLEKFNKGLSNARNVIIGKTGSILSRFSRIHLKTTKTANQPVVIYCPPNTEYLLEVGIGYIRVNYLFVDSFSNKFQMLTQVDLVTTIIESELPYLQFVTTKNFVYIFRNHQKCYKLQLDFMGSALIPEADIFKVPNPINPPLVVTPFGAPTGYNVDYLATLVIDGEESLSVEITTGFAKPIAAGQENRIDVIWTTTNVDTPSEVRIYSRPTGGGAYGFLGSTSKYTVVGATTKALFVDIGGLPDYSNGVQDRLTKFGLEDANIIDLKPKTGTIYQQRLILGNLVPGSSGFSSLDNDEEAIIASRPGYQNNFYRDFPYAADSAIQFKAGTSGKAEVLRFLDSNGLIVFTTNGIYLHTGVLSVNNLGLDRKGAWVIREDLPPLIVPDGVFFVDKSNVIRQFLFSQDIQAYQSIETSIFSNHLFKNRIVKSWSFQDGIFPIIIVTFTDGEFVTFTYNYEQQMKAWTRHDSKYPVEQVEGTGRPDRSFFVTNKDGQRYIEMNLPRYTPVEHQQVNPEYSMGANSAFMDAMVTASLLENSIFDVGQNFIITPVVAGVWDGPLQLTTNSGFLPINNTVGQIYRVFDKDLSAIDLEIITTGVLTVIVQPSVEFPSTLSTTARLYRTFNVVNSGISHLEGESVSVMVDGYIVASPYNDEENYAEVIVTGGSITLPDGMRGAIIHVGRPIVADIKTLNISTVEQSPTLIESINVNKMYIRINESRGLYLSNYFPEEALDKVNGTSVLGMQYLDEEIVPKEGIIGNRFFPAGSKRLEKILPGSWNNQGQISMRQVDPFHFELLSIIPDLTILKRRD